MGLNRDELIALPDLPVEEIDVPLWGKFRIAAFSAVEQILLKDFVVIPDEITGSAKIAAGIEQMAKMAVRAMVDKDGNRLLNDDEYPRLIRKKGAIKALNCISDAIYRINGINTENTAKNSEPSAIDVLPSD